jgi:hypothetical protein
MPKRAAVIKKIEEAAKARDMAFDFRRRGGNHDIYDLDGLMIPIERHRELTNQYAERIYRECQPRLGKSWWR